MNSNIVPKEKVPLLESSNCIIYEENLPFPYVHYPLDYPNGAFYAFQETSNSPLFYCSCQEKGLETYLHNCKGFSGIPFTSNELMIQNFIRQLQFKEKLCHVCNKVCPKYGYDSDTRIHTKFYSIYGYYINGLFYEYGVNWRGTIFAPELVPQEIAHSLTTYGYKNNILDEHSRKYFTRYCENIIRSRIGYFPVGQKWKKEAELLELVREIFPEYSVIHQCGIEHLIADIYIEELKLVIEYQGEQHFIPISHWGGEDGLKKTQERDKEKAELCRKHKIDIMYFSYKEELTKKFVKGKIFSHLRKKK